MPGNDGTVRNGNALSDLERQHPELLPWLRPLGVSLRALQMEPWRGLVPLTDGERHDGAPALHGALVPLAPQALRGHVRAVLAAAIGAESRARWYDGDAAALLESAVAHDDDRLADLAADADVEPERLAAAAQLAALPLLHACSRALAPRSLHDWPHQYCHVCGALPLCAEVLGLQRTRQLRCGRCGSAWETQVLLCPFCGERDHAKLGSLVPEGTAGQVCHVETCATCRAYWKTRTVLRPAAGEALLLDDASSLALDIAAADRGFERPRSGGFAARIRITAIAAVVS